MKRILSILALALLAASCDFSGENITIKESDAKYVGQAVGNFSAAEWYPGGELGTTDNVSPGSYEFPTPAVERMGLEPSFNRGEAFFERNVTVSTPLSRDADLPQCASPALTVIQDTATECGRAHIGRTDRAHSEMATCW